MKKKTWEEFRSSGLAWFINQTLHIFGWSIIFEVEQGKVKSVYPARVSYRGFRSEDQDEGYMAVHTYLQDNIADIAQESGVAPK